MAAQGKKRALDDSAAAPKLKKAKVAAADAPEKPQRKPLKPAVLAPEEIDFPRGGGSSFTPAEYKAIRSEAVKEADDELTFEVRACTLLPHMAETASRRTLNSHKSLNASKASLATKGPRREGRTQRRTETMPQTKPTPSV